MLMTGDEMQTLVRLTRYGHKVMCKVSSFDEAVNKVGKNVGVVTVNRNGSIIHGEDGNTYKVVWA